MHLTSVASHCRFVSTPRIQSYLLPRDASDSFLDEGITVSAVTVLRNVAAACVGLFLAHLAITDMWLFVSSLEASPWSRWASLLRSTAEEPSPACGPAPRGPVLLLYDRLGGLYAKFYASPPGAVGLGDMSSAVWQAVVACEDRRFFAHPGVDVISIIRAALSLGRAGGGSTITQQVVKNGVLSQARCYSRKATEALLALSLELRASKRGILAAYLGSTYWGHGAVGVGAAAMAYFGKRPSELDAREAALLAGILPCPEAASPFNDPQRALRYMRGALRAMARSGYLSREEVGRLAALGLPHSLLHMAAGRAAQGRRGPPAAAAADEDVGRAALGSLPTGWPYRHPLFVQHVLGELQQLGLLRLPPASAAAATAGTSQGCAAGTKPPPQQQSTLHVHTTLDPIPQAHAAAAAAAAAQRHPVREALGPGAACAHAAMEPGTGALLAAACFPQGAAAVQASGLHRPLHRATSAQVLVPLAAAAALHAHVRGQQRQARPALDRKGGGPGRLPHRNVASEAAGREPAGTVRGSAALQLLFPALADLPAQRLTHGSLLLGAQGEHAWAARQQQQQQQHLGCSTSHQPYTLGADLQHCARALLCGAFSDGAPPLARPASSGPLQLPLQRALGVVAWCCSRCVGSPSNSVSVLSQMLACPPPRAGRACHSRGRGVASAAGGGSGHSCSSSSSSSSTHWREDGLQAAANLPGARATRARAREGTGTGLAPGAALPHHDAQVRKRPAAAAGTAVPINLPQPSVAGLLRGYACLSAGGQAPGPHAVARVLDERHRVLHSHSAASPGDRLLLPRVCRAVVDALLHFRHGGSVVGTVGSSSSRGPGCSSDAAAAPNGDELQLPHPASATRAGLQSQGQAFLVPPPWQGGGGPPPCSVACSPAAVCLTWELL